MAVLTVPEKPVTSTRGNTIHFAEIVRDASKILIRKRSVVYEQVLTIPIDIIRNVVLLSVDLAGKSCSLCLFSLLQALFPSIR